MSIPKTADSTVEAQPTPTDMRLWSVTTIIKSFGDSDGLMHWAVNETAKAAIHKRATLEAILADGGPDEAMEWLTRARFTSKNGARSATKLGEDVHAACERYVVSGVRPRHGEQLPNGVVDNEIEPFVDSFDMWLDRFQPEYIAAEVTVYHPEFGYAGTADGYCKVGGAPVIIDYKTSRETTSGRGQRKKPWSDVGLQLAAYRHAPLAAVWRARKFEQYSRRYYLLNEDERELAVPTPEVEGGLVIFLTPKSCDVYPVDCGQEVFDAFCYATEAARWSIETSKRVIGKPLALMDKAS